MSILKMIAKQCKQTALYWGNPVPDGRGGFTWDAAVEVLCRWEQVGRMLKSTEGDEFICEAVVYVLQDMDVGGVLYVGSLIGVEKTDPIPTVIEHAYPIKFFEKIPAMNLTTDFIRKAYLGRGQG